VGWEEGEERDEDLEASEIRQSSQIVYILHWGGQGDTDVHCPWCPLGQSGGREEGWDVVELGEW
jgi:hypothetical protein